MSVTAADFEFVKTGFPKAKGWCHPEAAYLTLCLLARQTESGHGGGVLEIGVYGGRYLSVLYHHARKSSQLAVGVDTFQYLPSETVEASITEIFGSTAGLTLIAADSQTLTSERVLNCLAGRRPAFISVDGDHTAPGVCADLVFAKSILAEGGIIAVDDFLNPSAIGVSEGTYRFFIEGRETRLLPFCYASNKLFLADVGYSDIYRSAIVEFAREARQIPMNREFIRLLETEPSVVKQTLLGSETLIL